MINLLKLHPKYITEDGREFVTKNDVFEYTNISKNRIEELDLYTFENENTKVECFLMDDVIKTAKKQATFILSFGSYKY